MARQRYYTVLVYPESPAVPLPDPRREHLQEMFPNWEFREGHIWYGNPATMLAMPTVELIAFDVIIEDERDGE